MGKDGRIAVAIKALTPAELEELGDWFADHDGAVWDQQFATDGVGGRLDELGEGALADHAKGNTTPL
jgi:hypothetical protein